jgi:hypothetical protein
MSASDRGDVKIPSVSVVVELESTPRIVVDAECEADELALRAWVSLCRPDLERMLAAIAAESRARKAA